jgi:PAS domain S-box-containing protein
MIANIMAGIMIAWVAWNTMASAHVLLWSALIAGVSMYILLAGLDRLKPAHKRGRPAPVKLGVRAARKANVYAGMLGAMWALLPAMTFGSAPLEICIIIMGMTMGACGLGAFSLARVPSAAVIFASLVTTALAASSFMLGGSVGIGAAILGLIYGIALAAMIVHSHYREVERVAAETELEHQNKIIKLLLREFESGTKDWLWESNADGKITYASERLVQLSGKKMERVLGATLVQAVSAKRSNKAWVKLAKAMRERQSIQMIEVPVGTNGNTTWWQMSATPIFDDEERFTGYRGVAVDITESRKQTSELMRAKQEAERASLSKSQFLAMMSHELRTPLNSVVGYSELIVARNSRGKGSTIDRKDAEYAQNIADQGKHLNQLITNILDITRLERGKIELIEQEVDLNELTEAIHKICRIQAGAANVTLSARPCHSNLVVTGDLTRLKQILINLTVNAIKFTPAGGTVEICVAKSAKGCPIITVSDSGIGIEQSKIDRMFEPFTQADENSSRRYEGAGLGLAISRELARMHGGNLTLQSVVGQGTEAMLLLPCSRVVTRKSAVTVAA